MNLAEATLQLAENASRVTRGNATGGSSTQLIDTYNLTEANGFWKDGTLWLLDYDLVVPVTAFGENALTFAAQTVPGAGPGDPPAAVTTAEGDAYAVADADYPYAELVKAVNRALKEIGPIRREDETLVVDSLVGTYTLPNGFSKVMEVWIVDATDPSSRFQHFHWDEVDGTLRFDSGFKPTTDGNLIRLVGHGRHEELVEPGDLVYWGVNEERLKWESTVQLLKIYGLRRYGAEEMRMIGQMLQDAIQERDLRKGQTNRGVPKIMLKKSGW